MLYLVYYYLFNSRTTKLGWCNDTLKCYRDYSGASIVHIIAYIWLDTRSETSNGTNSPINKQNIALEMNKCDIFDTSPLIARGCCSEAYPT